MIQGPMGFSDLDHEGMLIEGFDQLGTMATIYNYAYYPKQMQRMGFVKDQDWQEYKITIPEDIPEKHKRIAEIVRTKYGLKTLKFKNQQEILPYAHRIFDTLNQAYSVLYGVSELSREQIDYYVRMYIPMLRYDYVTVIVREEDDKVVGFGITLPNLSRALQKAKGRLFPFGWAHLLRALKMKNPIVDLYLIGVIPEYQNKGVNALLFDDLIPIFQKNGVRYAESNPELETNAAVQMQWNYFERKHHKTRRAWIKKIDQTMLVELLKSKIHRVTVTEANLSYVGSITIDEDLIEAANILPGEKVQIVNNNNGARLETYVIAGERGSGVICLNGAAARLVQPGDTVIIMAYAWMSYEEAQGFKPAVVFPDTETNRLV